MPDQYRITPQDEDEIVFLYEKEFLSYVAIAELYKIGVGKVRNLLIRKGVQIRKRGVHSGRHFSDKEITGIIESYHNGETVRQLAIKNKANITTISNVLKIHDIPVRTAPQRRLDRLDEEAIIRDYIAGMTAVKVTQKHHTSFGSLKRILATHGIPYRTNSDYSTIVIEGEDLKTIIHQYQVLKMSVHDIAKKYGADEKVIGRNLRESGVVVDAYARFRPSLEDEMDMVRMYQEGKRAKDICRKYHCRHYLVTEILKRHGLEIHLCLQSTSKKFGYVGRYKHYIFRSLMELSFILDHENDHVVESAERKHRIRYWYDGKERTYHPDFILDSNTIVEIKPDTLIDDAKVRAKSAAIREYCDQLGLGFEIKSWPVDKERIRTLILNNSVKITNKPPEAICDYLNIDPKDYPHEIQDANR